MILNICLLLSIFAIVNSHLCLLNPKQRGSMQNINSIGTPDCHLTTGPCGGRDPHFPEEYFAPGENITIIFQKNLNHWSKENPGKFMISYENFQKHGSFHLLETITDTNSPSLTIYTINITLPRFPSLHGVIGVQYVSAAGTFYQCADIGIL